VRFTDTESYFVSEASVYRLLKAKTRLDRDHKINYLRNQAASVSKIWPKFPPHRIEALINPVLDRPLTASQAHGMGAGRTLSEVMTSEALDSYGWRIAFLIGAITLPFGLWMRTRLPETLHGRETGTVMAQTTGNSLGAIRANVRIMILGLLILASGTIITYVTQYMTTYAENTLHVATDLAFAMTVVSNGVGIVAALYGGWLADRAGRWPVMVWPPASRAFADLSGLPVDRGYV
jgi:MFS family permease